MKTNLIRFDIALGKSKPENILHRENPCPFCDRAHLENIIDEEDGMILLRNKYNVKAQDVVGDVTQNGAQLASFGFKAKKLGERTAAPAQASIKVRKPAARSAAKKSAK